MCPDCSGAFPKVRLGPNHISPRFGCCENWAVYFEDKNYGGIYEAFAGDDSKGWVFYLTHDSCSCGSSYPDMYFIGGKVEAIHPEHEKTFTFDDGSFTKITCPYQHEGPLTMAGHVHTKQ